MSNLYWYIKLTYDIKHTFNHKLQTRLSVRPLIWSSDHSDVYNFLVKQTFLQAMLSNLFSFKWESSKKMKIKKGKINNEHTFTIFS